MNFFRRHAVLLVILLAGLFFRMYHLGKDSLWADEGFAVRCAHLNLSEGIKGVAHDVHPPLYFILLHFWLHIFGDSEFSVRFLSLIFGLLALGVVYKIGTFIFEKNTGLLAAFLVAVSTFHIYYSQTARMYSLMSFLSLLSIYFFLRLFDRNSRGDKIGYVVSSALLLYTHYHGVFLIITQNLYLILRALFLKKVRPDQFSFKAWAMLESVLLFLLLPWLMIFTILFLFYTQIRWTWILMPSKFPLWDSFLVYAGHDNRFLVLLFALALIAMLNSKKDEGGGALFQHKADKVFFLLCWMFVPVLLSFLFSLFFFPIHLPRYAISSSLVFFLLAAQGISSLNSRPIKVAVIAVLVFLAFLNLQRFYATIHEQQWREVVRDIDAKAHPGDVVLFNSKYGQKNGFDYYSQRHGFTRNRLPEKLVEALNEGMLFQVQNYDRVWVVLFGPKDDRKSIKRILGLSWRATQHRNYVGGVGGIDVVLFEKK